MNAICPLGFLGGEAGFGEILLVLAVVLVLFGPRRLPEFARALGRILEELRRTSQDFKSQIMRLDEEPRSRLPARTIAVADVADHGVVGPPGVLSADLTPPGAAGHHESKSKDSAESGGSPPAAAG